MSNTISEYRDGNNITYIGNISFYLWNSALTGEREKFDLSNFEYHCAACERRIPYETENMYGVKYGPYICATDRCKTLYVLQHI